MVEGRINTQRQLDGARQQKQCMLTAWSCCRNEQVNMYTGCKEGLILTAGEDKTEMKGGCRGSWGTEMTNRKPALRSACCHQGQPEGGCQREPAGGHPGTCSSRHIKLASPCMKPFVQQNPA